MSEEKDEKKEIEIVSGDGSDLDISPVYDDINSLNPKKKNKDTIIIPKSNKEE